MLYAPQALMWRSGSPCGGPWARPERAAQLHNPRVLEPCDSAECRGGLWRLCGPSSGGSWYVGVVF